ncbi:hypothetical protein [Saccharibacillus sp. JS10]|uniref:hypothetical protein n=1 Tax=Saccharibacillus sp. JS10 TaxID=2950552 RepID=UPI00210931CD|nr:hypothetical protein [Saccharibacillus sp. JS10]MCQ4087410.1 hypothetical protein [Saccharibacillus sp. JS10]
MTYSQRGNAGAGTSSSIAYLEHRIEELTERAGLLLAEIESETEVSGERLTELQAELHEVKIELSNVENELAAYED